MRALLTHPAVVGLAEVMSFDAVIAGEREPLAKIAAAESARRAVDGHAPGVRGRRLNAYLAAGPDSDHECTTLVEAREKLSRGMWVFIREASFARNLEALAPLLLEQGGRRCCLVSDDVTVETLATDGHLDRLLRRAVRLRRAGRERRARAHAERRRAFRARPAGGGWRPATRRTWWR